MIKRFFTAIGNYWKRIFLGIFLGWLLCQLVLSIPLAYLEAKGTITESTTETAFIVAMPIFMFFSTMTLYRAR